MKIGGKVIDQKTKQGIPAIVFKSDATGKNLGIGTAANIDGNYTLDGINKGDYITASLVGLKPSTKQVGESASINFELSESATSTLSTFEVIDDKPTPKPLAPTENWFKRNETAVIITGVSIIALVMVIIIVKSTKKS